MVGVCHASHGFVESHAARSRPGGRSARTGDRSRSTVASGVGQVAGIVTDKLRPMAPRSPRWGLSGGVGVEAAARAQAHEETDRQIGQGQAELDGVIAGVEGEDRQRLRWRADPPAPARSGSARPPPG